MLTAFLISKTLLIPAVVGVSLFFLAALGGDFSVEVYRDKLGTPPDTTKRRQAFGYVLGGLLEQHERNPSGRSWEERIVVAARARNGEHDGACAAGH